MNYGRRWNEDITLYSMWWRTKMSDLTLEQCKNLLIEKVVEVKDETTR